MGPTPEWLVNIFLYIFLFGLIFTIVSLVLGFTNGIGLDLGGDADVDLDAGSDADGSGSDGPGVLNMPTITAFLTWFGGAGYIFSRSLNLGAILTVPLALASGVLGGAIMFFVIARLLWPMMTKPMSKTDFQLPGTPARVVSSIREGGVGEIVYTKSGSRFTAGARNVDNRSIAKGEEVVILRYERGIAYVQSVESILGAKGGEVESA